MLLVLHQLNNMLQQRKILEASAHRFGFSAQPDQLPDRHCQEFISILDQRLIGWLWLSTFSLVFFANKAINVGFVDIKMALFIILGEENRQHHLSML